MTGTERTAEREGGLRHVSELLPPIIERAAAQLRQRELRAGRVALGLEQAETEAAE